jgi:hypothetical protein
MSFDSPRVGTGFGKMSEEGLGGESDKIYKESHVQRDLKYPVRTGIFYLD